MKIGASLALAIAAAARAVGADEGVLSQDRIMATFGSSAVNSASTSPSFSPLQQLDTPAFSTAPFSSSNTYHKSNRMHPPVLKTTSWMPPFATGSPRRRGNRGSADKSIGSSVEPGTPLTKKQLQARKDSLVETQGLDGQSDQKKEASRGSFGELARKISLAYPQLDMLDPLATEDEDSGQREPHGNLRAVILAVITFLIALCPVYYLLEYLLFVTSVSAQCTPSTVYIPVTRFATYSDATPAIENSTTRVTVYSTVSAVETLTSYVTIQPTVMATGLTSSGGPSYYFTVNSAGSTDWLNGISPPATASLTVITRSIFVTPVMPTDPLTTSTATIISTATIQQTVTVPAYTSIEYSYAEPDTTITSTSTNYVTYTVSEVTTAGPSAEASPEESGPRASYSGPGVSGWNNTSTTAPNPTGIVDTADADPRLTTMTEIHYYGDDERTTSTRFSLITTSIQVAYTTIISPSVPEPSGLPEFVTTVTALPATITYAAEDGYSTSIAFNSSIVSPAATNSSVRSSSPYQTGASITPSVGTGILPQPPTSQSPAVLTNSTSPGVASYSPGVSPLSSLPSSAPAANSSTANPVTASSDLSSSLPTAPGPISISTSVSSQNSTTPASTSVSPLSIASSPSASLSSPSNATVASMPTLTTISGASSSVSSSVPAAQNTSLPAYGTPALSSPASSAVTAGPAGSSRTPTLSSNSSSLATRNSQTSSHTFSTSIRATSSSSLASPDATQPTVGLSSPTPTGSASGPTSSISVISYSQTFTPSTTSRIPGVPPSAASMMPTTGCGEYGDFMLDFDGLPNFSPTGENETDITQAPPIPNPYHHFSFSDGYVYAPDPKVPYEPVSPPHLAVFLGNGTGMRATQATDHIIEDGEFANGPYEASSSFWFDAFSAWMGCDNAGPEVCTLVMSAYTYDKSVDDEVLSFTQNATIEPCPGFKDCQLKKIEFPDTFKSLSGLQIQAFVGEEERMFFLDNVAMHWTDNSCVAGLTRQRAR